MSRVRAGFGDLCIVSDGMGGHRGGALAAELTVQLLEQHLVAVHATDTLEQSVAQAFDAANHEVHVRGHSGDPETDGMGATAIAVLAVGPRVLIAHVGDSRAYLFSRSGLVRLTKDHSRVQRMVDAGMLTAEEAESHPDSNIIERAIGQKPEVDVDIAPWRRVRRGDQILLCSDGLCGFVSDTEIAGVLAASKRPAQAVNELVDLALAKGGQDNITVQILSYGSGPNGSVWDSILARLPIVLLILLACASVAFLGMAAFNGPPQRGHGPAEVPDAPGPNGPA